MGHLVAGHRLLAVLVSVVHTPELTVRGGVVGPLTHPVRGLLQSLRHRRIADLDDRWHIAPARLGRR